MKSIFNEERTRLQERIEQLTAEIDSSKTTFDRYRERARDSLRKTAEEQQIVEAKLSQLVDQLKAERLKTSELEASHRRMETQYHKTLQEYDASIRREQEAVRDCRRRLDEFKEDFKLFTEIERQRKIEEAEKISMMHSVC